MKSLIPTPVSKFNSRAPSVVYTCGDGQTSPITVTVVGSHQVEHTFRPSVHVRVGGKVERSEGDIGGDPERHLQLGRLAGFLRLF